MYSFNPSSLFRNIGLSTLVLAMVSCNAAGGGMEGTAKQKSSTPKASEDVKDSTSYDSTGDSKPSNSNPTSTPAATPMPSSTQGGSIESEKVEIPSTITGALLFCFKDKIEGNKATVLCAVEDKTTQKPISLPSKYVSHKFSASAPNALTVTYKELPATALWHAEYTITAPTKEIVTAGVGAINFVFEGIDINDKKDSLDVKITNQTRPDLTIRSLKPQTAAEFRCFDYYRMKGDKVVTTPCGAQNSAQDWYITADNKIAHVSGVCIKFNPVSSLTIEGDCKMSDTPRFEITGEQIKILNTNTCVGLINPDLSGVDYVGVVTCNTGDNTQHWKIAPKVLP